MSEVVVPEFVDEFDDVCVICVCKDGQHYPTWGECEQCDCLEYVPMWALDDDEVVIALDSEDYEFEDEEDEPEGLEDGESSSPKFSAPRGSSYSSSELFVGNVSKQCAGPCHRIKLMRSFGSDPVTASMNDLCLTCRTTGGEVELLFTTGEIMLVDGEDFESYSEDDYEADLAERWQEDYDVALREMVDG